MPSSAPEALANVRDIVAVHSAKGGVGKSTLAVNLAVAFARMGMKVGLLDADVHGPSVAHMLGSSEALTVRDDSGLAVPVERQGVRYVSIANVAQGLPVVWRGPMVSQALTQLLSAVDWERPRPPPGRHAAGHGRRGARSGPDRSAFGCVTVTTPQEISLSDTRRGIRAFEQLQVPVLGLVGTCRGSCGRRVRRPNRAVRRGRRRAAPRRA